MWTGSEGTSYTGLHRHFISIWWYCVFRYHHALIWEWHICAVCAYNPDLRRWSDLFYPDIHLQFNMVYMDPIYTTWSKIYTRGANCYYDGRDGHPFHPLVEKNAFGPAERRQVDCRRTSSRYNNPVSTRAWVDVFFDASMSAGGETTTRDGFVRVEVDEQRRNMTAHIHKACRCWVGRGRSSDFSAGLIMFFASFNWTVHFMARNLAVTVIATTLER